MTIISVDNLDYFFDSSITEDYHLLQGVTVASNFNEMFISDGNGSTFTLDGHIICQNPGIAFSISGVQTLVSFGAQATFRASSGPSVAAIFMAGGSSALFNSGSITTNSGIAMIIGGGDNTIYNDGQIRGGTGGVFLGFIGGSFDSLTNDGTITVGFLGPPDLTGRLYHGVQIEGDQVKVINNGTINAMGIGGAGVNVGNASFGGGDATIINNGTITSARFWAIDMSQVSLGQGETLSNCGVISGFLGGVRASINQDRITNTGTILGGVSLQGGDDSFIGKGGEVAGLVSGGDGNDTLTGGTADDDFSGDAGNDRIRGGGGDDDLSGGGGFDLVVGGSGDDVIQGGGARDTLTGGAGGDVFVFNTVSDIGNGASTSDSITDFVSKLDKIDLSGLPGALTFIGTAAFSAVGQVRYVAATGLLEGNTTGAIAADFSLALGAGTVLVASDLIL